MNKYAGFSLLTAFLIALAGCQSMAIGGGDAQGGAKEVKFEYVAVLSNFSRKMTIRPDGRIIVEQQTSKDPKDLIGGEGRLSDAQRAELQQATRNWKQLKHVYPTDFGTVLTISYDGYAVQGTPNDKTPEQLLKTKAVLDKIAVETLRAAGVLRATTQPAGSE